MVVYAPVASQVYQRNVEPGEYVSPGVPLITLIDLDDMWIHFDLREDLVKTLKVGDRFDVRIPALADRRITVEVKLIATKGEYAIKIGRDGSDNSSSGCPGMAFQGRACHHAPGSGGRASGHATG